MTTNIQIFLPFTVQLRSFSETHFSLGKNYLKCNSASDAFKYFATYYSRPVWKTPLFPRDAVRTVIVHSHSGDSCIWFVNVCFRLTRSLQIYNENNGGNQSHLIVRLHGAKANAKVRLLPDGFLGNTLLWKGKNWQVLILDSIVTVRNSSWLKVMFSQAPVS